MAAVHGGAGGTGRAGQLGGAASGGPTASRAGRREWVALGVLSLAVLLIAVDGTVLSLAVPALSAALAPSATQVLWIGDVYSFALAGLLITMGSLGDRIGRRRLLLLGAAGFGAASALAAYAPSPVWLIAARALLGVAGATLMPSTLSIIRNLFEDRRQRTTAIALWSAMAGGGAAAGPLIGGLLLEHFWWGSVFVINLPVMALLLALGARLIPESRDPDPGPFDLAGAALSLVGVVSVVYAVKELATGGTLIQVFVPATLGGVTLTGFVRRQRRSASPMIDVHLFARPTFTGAVLVNLLGVFALSGLVFFVAQFLQLVDGHSPWEAGLRQLPLTLAAAMIAPLVSPLSRWAPQRVLVAAGLVMMAAGSTALGAAESMTSYLPFGLALGVIGLGLGLALTITVEAVVSAVPANKAGAASAVSETAYELGIALGIAILGSALTATYRNVLALPAGTSPDLARAAQDSLPAVAGLLGRADGGPGAGGPAAADVLAAARDAFVTAMQLTCGVATLVSLVAAAVAWRLLERSRT